MYSHLLDLEMVLAWRHSMGREGNEGGLLQDVAETSVVFHCHVSNHKLQRNHTHWASKGQPGGFEYLQITGVLRVSVCLWGKWGMTSNPFAKGKND